MFSWYNNWFRSNNSRINNVYSSDSGFGDTNYRSTNPYYPWNWGRPIYNNSHRPSWNNSWWRSPHIPDEPVEPTETEEEEKPEEVIPPKPLAIEVDRMMRANKLLHHTSDFSDAIFVVRRGQKFSLKVKVNRKHNKDQDYLNLLFTVGSTPQASKDTLVKLRVENAKPSEDEAYEWSAFVSEETTTDQSTELTVDVTAAADCVVGVYKLEIAYHTKEAGKPKVAKYLLTEVYILFNAWCKDDQVFLDSEEERKEYVLNKTGRIYNRFSRNYPYEPAGKPWSFDQFSKVTIKVAVLLLEQSIVKFQEHGSATQVARALSEKINANHGGVLVGNWSGNYSDGTSPTKWTGSLGIFDEYLETREPVKYGQCWVFSGLLTSVSRSLGIPTRSVTNFNSAHDTDESMTIDKHFDVYDRPMKHLDDSVWNFHVWNEGWFERPDLPEGYGGWQAFDATPQEESYDKWQCGPASLKCIKEGNIFMNFDAGFIYTEVNGTRMNWQVVNDQYKLLSVESTDEVGKSISTKAVNSSARNDITLLYKYAEGSEESKKVNAKVYRQTSSSKRAALEKYLKETKPQDVTFAYSSDLADNGDIRLNIEITNTTEEDRSFTMTITSHSTNYTGTISETLSDENVTVHLGPKQTDKKVWQLKGKDYLNEIDADAMISTAVVAKVKPTDQFFVKMESFSLEKPILDMEASDSSPKVGQEVTITMFFENPLDLDLTDCTFTLEGPGITREKIIRLDNPVEKRTMVRQTVTVTPKYAGHREIVAVFNSRQFVSVSGSVYLNVEEN